MLLWRFETTREGLLFIDRLSPFFGTWRDKNPSETGRKYLRRESKSVAEIKLFDKPQFHDLAFYSTLEMADHLHQPGHRERLLLTLFDIGTLIIREGAKSIADWGAGNGGLLSELKRMFPDIPAWGYDLLPANVEHAQLKLGVDVKLVDFTQVDCEVGEVVVLGEVLEHLVDPHGILRKLYGTDGVNWLVASSPFTETVENHWPFHLWIWNEGDYPGIFNAAGWRVEKWYYWGGGQFVVAGRPE